MTQIEPHKQQNQLDYPEKTMFEMIAENGIKHPNHPAFEFYGRKTSYSRFTARIEQCARALLQSGIGPGDAVTICMPNTPQALDCFYALNRIGAIANMVHPMSARSEITFYLNLSQSKMILTIDLFYETVEQAVSDADHPVTILLSRMQDELPPHLAALYILKKGRPYLKYPGKNPGALLWKTFLQRGTADTALPDIRFDKNRTSVILYSGGTSGTPKGIMLSDFNFNALAVQAFTAIGQELHPGLTMLSCMPCFHGFGLGINLHAVLVYGACCYLMPTFSAKTYADMLIKKKPNFIAGVPTIFEALLHIPELDGKDLSFLKGMFCGGDSLSVELKKKVDSFLKAHNARIQIREGYGLTECVTASCLTPPDDYREGSIGIPFPDMLYCIVKPGTDDELPRGTEGEIIISGPTLMLGYLNDPEETAKTMRVLRDGRTWIYTGDLGFMDEDGFVYFRQRIKRIIVTNGYNVYPSQLENVIDSCPDVSYSCIIGVPDQRRMQRVRAYVVPRDGVPGDDALKEKILALLKQHIALYALPKEILFRRELPKTLVGKVAYRKLEEEAAAEEAQKAAVQLQNNSTDAPGKKKSKK